MPQHWKTYKLSELGTIARGKSKHRPRDAAHLYGGKYPFIQTGDVKAANHRLNFHTQTYSDSGLAQSKLWPKDTMCITIAANIAETAILNYPACFPDSIIGFIADKEKCDIDFVEYLMQYFRKQIQSHSIGSVQENINLATFERIEFLVPPLPEQRAIASILSALDDKIELNLQMNKTLEEMAMALYKHWFVDFGPFKDGKFVESELGMIPEGWEVKSIYSMAEYVNGAAFKNHELTEIKEDGLPIIKIVEIKQGISSQTKYSKKVKDPKYLIGNGDILFSWSGNPDTSLGIFLWDKGEAYLNQHIFKVIPKTISHKNVVLSILKATMPDFIRMASHKQTTGLGHVTVQNLKDTNIIYPDSDSVEKYSLEIDPIFDLIYQNQIEKINLSYLRDSLLPKLISGEVTLKSEHHAE